MLPAFTTTTAGAAKAPSRPWDPSRSARLESALNEIVDSYRSGILTDTLRPIDLINLGGEPAALYFVICKRLDRAEWSRQKFPALSGDESGFSSLVIEINSRLSAHGLSVGNSKRFIVSHTDAQRNVILGLSSEFRDGLISKEQALENLHELGIRISSHQTDEYFGQQLVSPPRETPQTAARRALIAKVLAIKHELSVELSDVDCVKGVLFENFVGCFLAHQFGATNLKSQIGLPVSYRDLDGKRHGRVYLDFLLNPECASGFRIAECKWKNTFENVVTSVLPQIFALEQSESLKGNPASVRAVIICRNLAPDVQLMHESNVSLLEEAVAMGLDEVGRRAREVFDLIPIGKLIENHPEKESFHAVLGLIDTMAERGDVAEMRRLATVLERLRRNGEDIPLKLLGIHAAWGARREDLDHLADIVGTPAARDIDEQVSVQERIELQMSTRDLANVRLLCRLYNLHFKSNCTELTDEMVAALASVEPAAFEHLCLEFFAQSDARRAERILERRLRAIDSNPAREMRQIYDGVLERFVTEITFALRRHNESMLKQGAALEANFRTKAKALGAFENGHLLNTQSEMQELKRMLNAAKVPSPKVQRAALLYPELRRQAREMMTTFIDDHCESLQILNRQLRSFELRSDASKLFSLIDKVLRTYEDSIDEVSKMPALKEFHSILDEALAKFPHNQPLLIVQARLNFLWLRGLLALERTALEGGIALANYSGIEATRFLANIFAPWLFSTLRDLKASPDDSSGGMTLEYQTQLSLGQRELMFLEQRGSFTAALSRLVADPNDGKARFNVVKYLTAPCNLETSYQSTRFHSLPDKIYFGNRIHGLDDVNIVPEVFDAAVGLLSNVSVVLKDRHDQHMLLRRLCEAMVANSGTYLPVVHIHTVAEARQRKKVLATTESVAQFVAENTAPIFERLDAAGIITAAWVCRYNERIAHRARILNQLSSTHAIDYIEHNLIPADIREGTLENRCARFRELEAASDARFEKML